MLEFIYRYVTFQTLIWFIVAFPIAAAAVSGVAGVFSIGRVEPRFKGLVAISSVLASIFSAASLVIVYMTLSGFEVNSYSAVTGPLFRFVATTDMSVEVGLSANQLSLYISSMIVFVGLLTSVYSIVYMWRDPGFTRYFLTLNLLTFLALVFVLAENMVLSLVALEGMTLCSFFINSFWRAGGEKLGKGFRPLVMNIVADACLLASVFLVFGSMSAADISPENGMFNYETIAENIVYFVPISGVLAVLVFLTAAIKSALIPFQIWYCDAMESPSPASAFAYGSIFALVSAYLVMRFNFLFVISPSVMNAMVIAGVVSAVIAPIFAMVENDVKKIIVLLVVSQVALVFQSIGMGAFAAASFHLTCTVIFGVLSFMAAGSVIYALEGQRDIRLMGGLKARMPVTAWCFMVGAASLSGIFPLAGFFSRDAILWQAFSRGHTFLFIIGLLATGLSSFCAFRAAGSVFFGETYVPPEKFKRITDAPVSMLFPMMVLATLAIFGGFAGIPKEIGGSDHIGAWLGSFLPDIMARTSGSSSFGMKLIVTVVMVLWSLHFAILGLLIYSQKRDWPERIASRAKWLYKMLSHQLFMDEIYEIVIARPVAWTSKNIVEGVLDKSVIDGVVVGLLGRVISFASQIAAVAHEGDLRRSLIYFLIGAVLLVGLIAL